MQRFLLASTTLLLTWALGFTFEHALAQDKKPDTRLEFLHPDKAGPDFAIQGDYEGEIVGAGKLGAKVVAQGDGNFALVFLPGGLPAAGWDGKTRIKSVNARTVEGKAIILPKSSWTGELSTGVLTGKTKDGTSFSLKRVIRSSPSLGAKPPAGAVVLFDGSGAEEWDGGKLVDGFLFHVDKKWATSKKAFRDYQAHVEFRVPFMPYARGQGRANSGVYLDQRNKSSRPGYELQVLDSFGLDEMIDGCGAVYAQKAPLVNMCYPPLTWQTFDIQFKAARFDKDGKKTASPVITVHHNGVRIHDNLELQESHYTGGEKALTAKPGAIMLQNYVGSVHYRNIWVVEMH